MLKGMTSVPIPLGGTLLAYDSLPNLVHVYEPNRRVLTSYTGPLVKLRRGGDGVEMDFGYNDNNDLDRSSIRAWLNGAAGLLKTIYDQKGGKNVTMTDNTKLPQYSEVGFRWVNTTGKDDALVAATASDWKFLHDGSDHTILTLWRTRLTNPDKQLAIYDTGGLAQLNIGNTLFMNDLSSGGSDDKVQNWISRGVSGAWTAQFNSANDAIINGDMNMVVSRYENGIVGNDLTLRANGVDIGGTDTINTPSVSDPSGPLTIGRRYSTGFVFDGYINVILIFNTALSSADINALESAVDNYYRSRFSVINLSDMHDGFPMIMNTGSQLLVLYRSASVHAIDLDGVINQQTSSDGGRTWSSPVVIHDGAGVRDPRGPCPTLLSNGDIICSLFRTADGSDIDLFVMISEDGGATWGVPYAIGNGDFTLWAACRARIVELANGDLLLPVYGLNTGDTFQSSSVLKSEDDGATWAQLALIADGEADSKGYVEPFILLLANGDLLCLIRDLTNQLILKCTSADNGATWSSITTAFTGNGAFDMCQLPNGRIVVVTREGLFKPGILSHSDDNGSTWSTPTVFVSDGDDQMTYASIVPISNTSLKLVWGMEYGANQSNIYYMRYDL